jgi:hypothetical protein
MKKEVDFSHGVRGKYASQRLRIVGDPKMARQKTGGCRYVVTLPGGVEFDVYARNNGAARQAACDYFGRPHLPKGTRITLAAQPLAESAQVTAIGETAVVVLPKKVLRKLKAQFGDTLYFVETHKGIELTSERIMAEALKKPA